MKEAIPADGVVEVRPPMAKLKLKGPAKLSWYGGCAPFGRIYQKRMSIGMD